MKKLNKRGFTLIELIIVIVVIGLLAGMALPKFMGVQRDAKAANLKNDCDVLQTVSLLIESQRNETDQPYGVIDAGVTATAKVKVDKTTDLGKAILLRDGVAAADIATSTITFDVVQLDSTKYASQLSKSVKTGELADFGVITTTSDTNKSLVGTVVYVGKDSVANTLTIGDGVTDGSGNEYFGVDINNPA